MDQKATWALKKIKELVSEGDMQGATRVLGWGFKNSPIYSWALYKLTRELEVPVPMSPTAKKHAGWESRFGWNEAAALSEYSDEDMIPVPCEECGSASYFRSSSLDYKCQNCGHSMTRVDGIEHHNKLLEELKN